MHDSPSSYPQFSLIGLLLWTLLLMLLLSGCSEDESDGVSGSSGSYVWVYIQNPSSDISVETSGITLDGRASCPDCPPSETAFGYCPPVSGFIPGGDVSVNWINHTSGATGVAFSGISGSCSCFLSYCTVSYHRGWYATVPLTFGANSLEVIASDLSGSTGSDSRTITRLPSVPTGLTASAGHGQITLSWTPVPEATSYNLYWSTSRNLTTTSGTKITGVTNPYLHSGLSDDVPYYYLVTAVSGTVEGKPSSVVFATPGWASQSVASLPSTSVVRDLAIAVDSNGYAHIHYSYDDQFTSTTQKYNYYTTNASGNFIPQFVTNPAWINAAIGLASDNTVHIGYLGQAGITHAIYTSGLWNSEAADAQGECDGALAMDATNKVHLAYQAYTAIATPDKLRYATNGSGSWVTTDLASYNTLGCARSGKRIAIAVDNTNIVHIAYAGDYPGYGLHYVTNRGGSWSDTLVVPGTIVQISLAVEPSGKLHIVYLNNASEMYYATNTGGGWSIELLDSAGYAASPSLALDSNGKAHISYFNNQYGELRYAQNSSGSWQILPIADTGYAASAYHTNTSIAVDSLGKIHIGYYDNRSGNLSYVTNQ